ncbi:MAG: hypothetical protein A2W25_13795 [candidate division Zixibacteria bacterium RBG_16_53_22]|nr:MAG: hypothetical protein A2W25_13795 [candidate division Zixibacteria bacterium RBG_16_53_22]
MSVLVNKKEKKDWRRAVTDPVHFARAFLGIEPHPGQEAWLSKSSGFENALVTGNRWGKSDVQAVKLLHRAFFQIRPLERDIRDYYRCVNVAITQDQADIIFGKMIGMIGRSTALKALVKSIRQTPFPHIALKNGSEIWARSSYNRGEYILGHDFDYINFDEAAYEPYGEWVVDGVMKMRLADRCGMLDFSSTPNGLNWFYRRCQAIAREGRGHVQHGSTLENPHLSANYIEQLKSSMSPSRLAQHLQGKFTSFEGRLFPEDVIQRCLVGSNSDGNQRNFVTKDDGRLLIHGWDLARKVTYTVGVTLDVTSRPFHVVEIIRMQRDWPVTIRIIKETQQRFGGITVIDSTGLGDVVLAELDDIGAVGVNFGGGNRDLLLVNLERAIFAGEVTWPDTEYSDDGRGKWSLTDEIRAMDKAYTNVGDGVCALALALWQVRQRGADMPGLRAAVGRF